MVEQEWQFLGACASLFFGVILAQTQFRAKIPSYELVFFEYFYFILHAAILLVSLATLFYWFGIELRVLRYQEGLILKLLYWPLILMSIIIISFIYLY
jgi:hypothetical protein